MKQGFDRFALMQTFIRIVEAGNLSAAATQMNTTQPTISRRLQALEKSLGVSLVQRTTHSLRLTEAGERFYHRAREMDLAWSEFESDMRGSVEEAQGTLRVVAPHAFGQHQLVGPLTQYLSRNPKVSVEWLLHDLQPNFVEGGIDCSIHVGEVSTPSTVAIKIGEVPRIVVASPALIGNSPLPQNPEDLKNQPWLALIPYYRNEVRLHKNDGGTHAFNITPRIVTDSLYALRSATLLGSGIAISSAWVVREEIAAGRLLHLLPAWQAQPLPAYITYPYAPFYPAKLRYFVDAIKAAIDWQAYMQN